MALRLANELLEATETGGAMKKATKLHRMPGKAQDSHFRF